MFFEFIKNHYELIAAVVLVLVSIILTIIKKKPVLNKIDEVKAYILEALPGIIKEVECPGHGIDKKLLVLNSIKLLIATKYNFYDFESLKMFVSEAIENILSTPTKKEE